MKIGITTTVPIEVLMAAGFTPIDLNNVFIGSPEREHLVRVAEWAGFPQNCCAWIKGIYGVCTEYGIRKVVCVTNGDCSNTGMLMEVLRLRGIETIPFAYPNEPAVDEMQSALELLGRQLNTTIDAAEEVRTGLQRVRAMASELDDRTWRGGSVSGLENHKWLVTASDFGGDVSEYESGLGSLLAERGGRRPYPGDCVRLAFVGVPPVFADELYPFIERNGGRVVFNEIQRQFSMPFAAGSLAEQYCRYTYPYSIMGRVEDISAELRRRSVDGVIHYVQAFCHRGIGDIILRSRIGLPMLTLEGNSDFSLGHSVRTRIETFIDMLRGRIAAELRSASESERRAV